MRAHPFADWLIPGAADANLDGDASVDGSDDATATGTGTGTGGKSKDAQKAASRAHCLEVGMQAARLTLEWSRASGTDNGWSFDREQDGVRFYSCHATERAGTAALRGSGVMEFSPATVMELLMDGTQARVCGLPHTARGRSLTTPKKWRMCDNSHPKNGEYAIIGHPKKMASVRIIALHCFSKNRTTKPFFRGSIFCSDACTVSQKQNVNVFV